MTKPRATEPGATTVRETTAVLTLPHGPDVPMYPTGGDPVRRARLRAHLVRCCASRDLDALIDMLLGIEPVPLVLIDRGDYWHEAGMDLGVPERDHAGRVLAELRYVP